VEGTAPSIAEVRCRAAAVLGRHLEQAMILQTTQKQLARFYGRLVANSRWIDY